MGRSEGAPLSGGPDAPPPDGCGRAAGDRDSPPAGTVLGLVLSFAGGWGLWLCGQALLAVMLVQWFVILHECGHETLFRTRRWHAAAGRVAAAFSLIPYHSWTRVHGRHHKWTGWQDLDPTTESLVPRPLGRAERDARQYLLAALDPAVLGHLPRQQLLAPRRGCCGCFRNRPTVARSSATR